MARRRGFLQRLVDIITGRQEPRRRATPRETRQFRRGREVDSRVAEQYAKDRRDAYETRLDQQRRQRQERREREQRPYRRAWRDEGYPSDDFDRHYRLFNQLPLGDDITNEEKQDLWQSYLDNMVSGGGYEYNDPFQNPFWSDLGMAPEDFNWAEWRRARGYSRR